VAPAEVICGPLRGAFGGLPVVAGLATVHNAEAMIVFLLFMLIWLVIAGTVIAVHFWFLTLPVLCIGGGALIRRRKRQKELARLQPGVRDPWLNEVVVAVSDLDFEEKGRNLSRTYRQVPVEGYVELRQHRLVVDVVLFSDQILARHCEVALRADSAVRSELSREMTAMHNLGRVLIIGRTNMGAVDEYDFAEIARLVRAIPLPPPLAAPRPVTYTSPQRTSSPPAPARAVTATLPRPAAPLAAPPVQSHDAIDQLDRLGRLRESGVLTEDEFQAKKTELLQRI
jgi:hypothetical protein